MTSRRLSIDPMDHHLYANHGQRQLIHQARLEHLRNLQLLEMADQEGMMHDPLRTMSEGSVVRQRSRMNQMVMTGFGFPLRRRSSLPTLRSRPNFPNLMPIENQTMSMEHRIMQQRAVMNPPRPLPHLRNFYGSVEPCHEASQNFHAQQEHFEQRQQFQQQLHFQQQEPQLQLQLEEQKQQHLDFDPFEPINIPSQEKRQKKERAHPSTSFPVKLYSILSDPFYREFIEWLPHGRAWRVLKPKAFQECVLPLFFRSDKYSSFMRQVNGWGFKRITEGVDLNAYWHEKFLRGMPDLCKQMRRPRAAQQRVGRSPNFYTISKIVPLPDLETPLVVTVNNQGPTTKTAADPLEQDDASLSYAVAQAPLRSGTPNSFSSISESGNGELPILNSPDSKPRALPTKAVVENELVNTSQVNQHESLLGTSPNALTTAVPSNDSTSVGGSVSSWLDHECDLMFGDNLLGKVTPPSSKGNNTRGTDYLALSMVDMAYLAKQNVDLSLAQQTHVLGNNIPKQSTGDGDQMTDLSATNGLAYAPEADDRRNETEA